LGFLPDGHALHVNRGNLGRQAEERARRHHLGKRGARLDHGAGRCHFDAENDAGIRRPDIDPAQRILGNLGLFSQTRDLAAHVGDIRASVLAQPLRGLKDLLAKTAAALEDIASKAERRR
jgi:hypothetical protein